MGNSLHRDITVGEVVVILWNLIAESSLRRLEGDMRYVANGGFGMNGDTMGSALYGHWLREPKEPGDSLRMEGYDIDAKATEIYQADPNQYQPVKPEYRLLRYLIVAEGKADWVSLGMFYTEKAGKQAAMHLSHDGPYGGQLQLRKGEVLIGDAYNGNWYEAVKPKKKAKRKVKASL